MAQKKEGPLLLVEGPRMGFQTPVRRGAPHEVWLAGALSKSLAYFLSEAERWPARNSKVTPLDVLR